MTLVHDEESQSRPEGEGRPHSGSGLGTVDILGVDVVAAPFAVVVGRVMDVLLGESANSEYLCPTGVHGVIEATKDPLLRQILNDAFLTVADGMPLVRVARWRGFRAAERSFGPAIMSAVLERTAHTSVRHFFYGGRPGVADSLASKLPVRYPGLQVAGTYCPPFRALTEDEEAEVVRQVHSTGADALWVGLSTPKQERWVSRMRSRLRVKMLFSVGAAFDYLNGSISQAPEWMQQLSLEWLFRALQEPRRLGPRYAEIVPKFIFLMTLDALRLRRFRT